MAGAIFQVGEQKVRPGVYVRVTSAGESSAAVVPQGIVATLFRSSWGPLGEPVVLENEPSALQRFSGGTVDAVQENFRGGCRQVVGYRLGTGGAKAMVTLQDTTAVPVDAVKLEALYEGVRGNNFTVTIRGSLSDDTKRELLLYEGATLRQTVEFTKGVGEAAALVEALSDSPWVAATLVAEGTLAVVAQAPFAGGEDPTVTGEAYSAGLSAIEAVDWNVLCVDTDDAVTHAVVQAYIGRVRNEGKRVCTALGEPVSVELSTRLANAAAFNDPAVIYVANGFVDTAGNTLDGYKAAARVAGMVAAAQVTDSLTHAVVQRATGIVGALTNAEIEQAIQSGALVFSMSAQKQVHIESGITTFVTPTADMDAGWKKIRRMKTRDNLIERIVATWDPLIGKVDNDTDGRATLIAAAQGIINEMVGEGALVGGTLIEDKNNPPVGDSAWFLAGVDDKDSAERVYIAFGFRFSPVA
jgi:hypothetical protein